MFSALIGFLGARQTLALCGIWPVNPVRNDVPIGDAAFQKRWAVACEDRAYAVRVLTPAVQQLLMASVANGASWWSLGSGWVSCVSRHEPLNRTHGRIMRPEAMARVMDDAAGLARMLEGER